MKDATLNCPVVLSRLFKPHRSSRQTISMIRLFIVNGPQVWDATASSPTVIFHLQCF